MSALLVLFAVLCLEVAAIAAMIRDGREKAARRVLVAASVTACLLLLEGVFACTSIPDGFDVTLSSARWRERYWEPINSRGYRDVEHAASAPAGRRTLFFCGDAVTAGHGIADPRDRFPEIVAARLGAEWEGILLARPGWDTRSALNGMLAHPRKPDAIVMQFGVNDIEGAALAAGRPFAAGPIPPRGIAAALVNRSNLCNFAYWNLGRGASLAVRDGYTAYLRDAYRDPAAWKRYAADLHDLATFARERHAPLCVIVFPELSDVDGSRDATSRVATTLAAEHVDVIDLTERLTGRNWLELVVNRWDAHPGAALHREVADLVLEWAAHALPN